MLALKDLKLSQAEMLWLQAIYDNGGIPEPKTFKVKFHSQLPKDFGYANLHNAFIWNGRLNIFGIWLVNPKDKVFENLHKTIKAIQSEILKNPRLESISGDNISKLTGIELQEAKEALTQLVNHPGFCSSAYRNGEGTGQDTIGFSGDGYVDAYLNYDDIPTLLENTWVKLGLGLMIRPEIIREIGETRLYYSKLCHVVVFGKKKWSFHTNAAKVVRILVETYKRGLPEIHIDEIHSYLPKEIQSDSLSQIFKSHKGESWKELVITGPSGKGFWQLNPKYLEKGVEEIDLGLTVE